MDKHGLAGKILLKVGFN